jgi:hypothetical protein
MEMILQGFSKDIKAYSFLLKDNEKLPVITAAASNNNIVTEVEQAKGHTRELPLSGLLITPHLKEILITSISISLGKR